MQLERFRLDLDPTLETASGEIAAREGFLVRLERDGTRGIGEATPLPSWTESLATCRDALKRAETIATELDWGIALARLEAPAARHGLALALADAKARAEETPLYRDFGATRPVERIPVNGTVGDGPPAATAKAALKLTRQGFTCLKVKVGVGSFERDRRRLEAIDDALGDEVGLRLDANGTWDRETAAKGIDLAAQFGVSYVEQPLPAADLEGLAGLRGRGTGIAVDETLIEHDLDAVVSAGVADIAVCKPMVLGGPDRAVAVARSARAAGIEPVLSTTIDGAVARAAAVHVAATVPEIAPCGLATADRLTSDLCPDPVPVTAGAISVPQGPGLGLPEVLGP